FSRDWSSDVCSSDLQMWQRLQQGKSWLGAVKNRCKNGDYYWVRAYVIPILDNAGNILELQSIRARLETPARQRAERLYAGLSKNQPGHGPLPELGLRRDRKSTRLNSSHVKISYAVFC